MNRQLGKVLVTGATGLVGSRLLPRLVEAGLDCIAIVRGKPAAEDTTAARDATAVEGATIAEGAIGTRDATAVEADLLDPASLAAAFKDVSAIIHLAAVFRSPDTDLIWKSNLEGTRNLIDAAKKYAPGSSFIFASTSHVYNIDNPHPGREDDDVSPKHAYPASKVAAEQLLRDSGLDWSILRFPFVYGDGDGHLEALPEHVLAAKYHPAKRISTIHHRDIFTAMVMALDGRMNKRIVNISDEAPTTIYELLNIVGARMPSSSDPLVNPWHLHADASLARSLGFQPTIRTVYQAKQENLL